QNQLILSPVPRASQAKIVKYNAMANLGKPTAALALESGRIFFGESFGFKGENTGEVVFNTSMTGYQEILTDPSYKGQIIVMTEPHIGNVGVNPEDPESGRIFCEGLV